MLNSLKRVLASAAHAPRQRAMSAGVAARAKASTSPSKEEEDVKSWTCDDVIEWARSHVSAKALAANTAALKAAELDGATLLHMRQDQTLIELLRDEGLAPRFLHDLGRAVRERVPVVPVVEGVLMGCVLLRHPCSLHAPPLSHAVL